MSLFGKDVDKLAVPVTIGGEYNKNAVLFVESGVTADSAIFNLAKAAEKAGYNRVMNLRVVGSFDSTYDAVGDAVTD